MLLNHVFSLKNCSSISKGGTFHISENSILKLLNSTIINSYAPFGSIIYLQENYFGYVYIENSIFSRNHGNQTLLDAIHTKVILKNCSFINNTNTLFYLIDSQIQIDNISILNHFCSNDKPGCVLSAINTSTSLNIIELINIRHDGEEGNFYFENSQILINSLKMENVKTKKIKGSCSSIYNSSFNLYNSQLHNYQINCFFGFESMITIKDTLFDNSDLNKSNIIYEYGTFYCQDCSYIVINNSKFIKNSYVVDGSAIFIQTNIKIYHQEVQIAQNDFIENIAFVRGTIFVDSTNIHIRFNNFFGNKAKIGGAIFMRNQLSN